MNSRLLHIESRARVRKNRPGFSFTEILFAIIILGIGFIMAAGMFPVAIQQAKSTTEETAGTSLARAAAGILAQSASDSAKTAVQQTDRTNVFPAVTSPLDDPARPPVLPLSHKSSLGETLWNAVRGDLIRAQDRRVGWTALYRRLGEDGRPETWAPYAQVFIFSLRAAAPDVDTFDPVADAHVVLNEDTKPIPNLLPHNVQVTIVNDYPAAGGLDVITILPSASEPEAVNAAVEGAFVVIKRDRIVAPSTMKGWMNGRLYRLGLRRTDLGDSVYELAPGYDFTPDPGLDGIFGTTDDVVSIGTPQAADAYIIGRGYSRQTMDAIKNAILTNTPLPTTYEFAGPSMAIGAYVTHVRIKP